MTVRAPSPLDLGIKSLIVKRDVVPVTLLEEEGFSARHLNTTYCGRHKKFTLYDSLENYRNFEERLRDFLGAGGSQWQKLRFYIEKHKPKVLLIDPVGFPSFSATRKVAEIVKKMNPETKVGVFSEEDSHISISSTPVYSFFLKDENIDFVIKGDAEKKIVETVKNILFGESLSDVSGLAIRERGRIKTTENSNRITNLNDLPVPDMNLVIEKDKHPPIAFTWIKESRGCKYNCSFCSSGKPFKLRSPENVIKEIEYMYNEFGTREFNFQGSSFLHNKNWTKRFCKLLRESEAKIMFSCRSNVDQLDGDILDLLSSLGCFSILTGIESGSKKILQEMKKPQNVNQIQEKEVVEKCRSVKDRGINLSTGWVMGYPSETKEDLKDTINLLKKVNPDFFRPQFLVPIPKTELYSKLKKQGLIKDQKFDKYLHSEINVKTEIEEGFLRKVWKKYARISDIKAKKELLRRYARPRNIYLKGQEYKKFILERLKPCL